MNKNPSSLPAAFADAGSDNAPAQSNDDLRTPTIRELSVAIEVLTKFVDRLNAEAATSIIQLPDTQLGAHYAGKIGTRAIEQTARIKYVNAELRKWHAELVEQSRPGLEPDHGIKRPSIAVPQSSGADKNIENAGPDKASQWGEVKAGFEITCDDARGFIQKSRDWLSHRLNCKGRA